MTEQQKGATPEANQALRIVSRRRFRNAQPLEFARLWPFTLEEFFAAHWSNEPCLVRGHVNDFAALMPWKDLNQILYSRKLEDLRLRFVKSGEQADPARYSVVHRIRKSGATRTRTDPAALAELLRDGFTMVIDEVDGLVPALDRLVQSFENTLQEQVQANLYTGWNQARGFKIHWDDHDVYVLQVHGRKSWKLFGKTRENPSYRDTPHDERVPENAIWEGILEAGDLLYVPRGYWHAVEAREGETLHLTLGAQNRTGADYLRWLADYLLHDSLLRMDIPLHSRDEDVARYLGELSRAVLPDLSVETVRLFRKQRLASLSHRSPHSLPFSVDEEQLGRRTLVRWSAYRDLGFEEHEGEIAVQARGMRYRFAAGALPMIKMLLSDESIEAGELIDGAGVSEDHARAFLARLLSLGLVEAREP